MEKESGSFRESLPTKEVAVLWLAILTSIITAIISYQIKDQIGGGTTFVALLAALALVFAFHLSVDLIRDAVRKKSQAILIDNAAASIETILKSREEWFYSMTRLQDFERNCKEVDAIWVVSRSLKYEVEMFKDVVRSNLARGIKYTYICPDSGESEAAIGKIKRLFQSGGNVPKIEKLPESFFDYPCDLLIFNPPLGTETAGSCHLFMDLKFDKNITNRAWVKIDEDEAGMIARNVARDLEENTTVLTNENIRQLKEKMIENTRVLHETQRFLGGVGKSEAGSSQS